MSSSTNLNKTMKELSNMRLSLSPIKTERDIIPFKMCKKDTSRSLNSDICSTNKNSDASNRSSISFQSDDISVFDNPFEVPERKLDFESDLMNIEVVAPKINKQESMSSVCAGKDSILPTTLKAVFSCTERNKKVVEVENLNLNSKDVLQTSTNDIISEKSASRGAMDISAIKTTKSTCAHPKQKCSSQFKGLLRDMKRFFVTDFRNYMKEQATNTKSNFEHSINQYVSAKIGVKTPSEDLVSAITTIVCPKMTLKKSKDMSVPSDKTSSGKSVVVLQDLIFKFTLEKAQEVFRKDSYKIMLECFLNHCSSQASKFKNEAKTLLEF